MQKEIKENKLPIILLGIDFILFPSSELRLKFNNTIKEIIFDFIDKSKSNGESDYILDVLVLSNIVIHENLIDKSIYLERIKNIDDFSNNDSIGVIATLAELNLSSFIDRNSEFDKSVLLKGKKRVKINKFSKDGEKKYFEANFSFLENNDDIEKEEIKKINEQVLSNILDMSKLEKSENVIFTEDFFNNIENSDIGSMIDIFAQNSELIDWVNKYKIFNSLNLRERAKILCEISSKELKKWRKKKKKEEKKDGNDTEPSVIDRIRSSLEELTDKVDRTRKRKINRYIKKLKENRYPDNIRELINENLDSIMDSHPGDAGVSEKFVDWLLNLPWYQETEEKKDLNFARKALDSHYGLKEVKEKIIEHLVSNKRGGLFGQVICLVGPPGTGKTSIAFSIAQATGRKFVKISLAGMNDASMIRGFQRAYVGASPGIIIEQMKKVGVVNPLFLINEIDKISHDYRGFSVITALLEVLDSDQNKNFTDDYLKVPYDLSKVLFICTANDLSNLSREMIDRMDIIEVPSYTEKEKIEIAKNYLIPEINKEYNLSGNNLISFSEESIEKIIRYYTREAGVRELKRKIYSIFRKIFVEKEENENNDDNDKKEAKLIIPEDLNNYLKKEIFEYTKKNNNDQAGICTGLAYTGQGGDIIIIEVASFLSKKEELKLTGNLGNIMKESANVSIGYIRSNCEKFGIDKDIFFNREIHIHVPEGATPKEGPSAGIALTSAIISCLTGKFIDREIGMTGEITLLGNVKKIGGLREKALGAQRSGLKSIIIPKENEKDIEDIPSEIRDKLKIYLVEDYKQVFNLLFMKKNNEEN